MASNLFSKVKKNAGGKVKFDRRSMRQQMSLLDSTKLTIVSIADSETNSLVDKVSTYPNFTIINTKLVIVCSAIMKNIRPYSDENFGQKVLEYENDIYRVFNVTEEVKKMKLLEDIVCYSQYINYINTSMEEYDEESDYSEESDYEEDD